MSLTSQLPSQLPSQLRPDEQVLWFGQPVPSTHCANALPLFLCGIPWTGFSLFRLFIVDDFKLPDFSLTYDYVPLLGIPFLLIGMGMLLSPYWVYRKAKHIHYVITSQRVLQVLSGKTLQIQEFPLDKISTIEKIETATDTGDLFFANADEGFNDYIVVRKVGFKGIHDVNNAEKILRQAVKNQSDKHQ